MPKEFVIEYPQETKDELIQIIEKANEGIELNNREIIMIFHYMRNKDKPEYAFVDEYFEAKNKKKKRGSPKSRKHIWNKGKPKHKQEDSSK